MNLSATFGSIYKAQQNLELERQRLLLTVKTWALVQSDDAAISEDAHLTPPSHWLPGRGTLYGGRAGREPLSLNAGDAIVTLLASVSSGAHTMRLGFRTRVTRFPASRAMVTVKPLPRHRFLPLMQAASASRYRTRLRAQIRIDAPRPNVRHRGDTYNAS